MPGWSLFLLVGAASAGDVRVEDAGASHRQVLRYRIPNGARQRVELTVAAEMTITEDELAPAAPVQLPRASATLDLRTVQRSDGAYSVALIVRDVDVGEGSDPGQNAVFERDLRVLLGQEGVLTMSPDGEVTHAELAPAISAPEDGRKQPFDVRELGVRFPSEPVGVGAVWSYDKEPAYVSGVEVTQHVVCRLEAVRGRMARVALMTSEDGAPGPVPIDDPTGMARLFVDELTAHGDAVHVVRLDRPAVVDGQGSLDMFLATTAEVMGVSMSSAQRIVIRSTLSAMR